MIKKPLKKNSLLYEQVQQALTQYIDESQLQPGDKFPSEREFVDSFGVSRNVLREAFHILESRGIVVSHQGKGRFLRRIPNRETDITRKSDGVTKNLERYFLLEAYEVRKLLECYGMGLLIEVADEKDLNEIEETYNKMAKQFELHKKTIGELDLHRLYVEKSGNFFLQQVLEIVFSAILDFMHHNFLDIYETHYPEQSLQSHRRIIAALRARDRMLAEEEMTAHLQTTIDMIRNLK